MNHLRPDQLAELLRVSKRTIYRGLQQGWIDKTKVRGQTRAIIPQEVRDMMSGDRLLRPVEVARTLSVAVSTIYRWFWEGRLAGCSFGSRTIRLFESGVRGFVFKGITK
jgi:excisionase family DNA binding protein